MSKIISIYRNLNKHCLSKKVSSQRIEHVDHYQLQNVRFHVNQNGRNKATETGVRNVHAFVKGYDTAIDLSAITVNLFSIKYNPFRKSERAHHFFNGGDMDSPAG